MPRHLSHERRHAMSKIRAAALALALTTLASTACVRGRNDGGKDAAGGANNGAGPAASR